MYLPLNHQWSSSGGLRHSEGNLLLRVLSQFEAVFVERDGREASLTVILGNLHGDVKIT